jgi:hypothetical protein
VGTQFEVGEVTEGKWKRRAYPVTLDGLLKTACNPSLLDPSFTSAKITFLCPLTDFNHPSIFTSPPFPSGPPASSRVDGASLDLIVGARPDLLLAARNLVALILIVVAVVSDD